MQRAWHQCQARCVRQPARANLTAAPMNDWYAASAFLALHCRIRMAPLYYGATAPVLAGVKLAPATSARAKWLLL